MRCRRLAELLPQPLLAAIAVIAMSPEAARGCDQICGPPHNEIVPSFSAARFQQLPGLVAPLSGFRLTGFGLALANEDVANCDPGENPQVESSILTWSDFRFYAAIPDLPGSGIVKGTLNPAQDSQVTLQANDFAGNGGLFPASLTNEVFLRLIPVDFPAFEYRNASPVVMHAASTPSAPPDSSVVTSQQGTAVFDAVGTPPPGFPGQLSFSGGAQTFLDPVAISLALISTSGGIVQVQVSNPLPEAITVAYFLHIADEEPLADLVEDLDGTVGVGAQAQAQFEFDVQGLPIDGKPIVVDAMVLVPEDVEGHDRLIFTLHAIPALGERALIAFLVLLFAGGAILFGRRRAPAR